MPPQPAVPHVVRIAINQTIATRPIVNILHVQYAPTSDFLTAAQLDAFVKAVSDIWQGQIIPLQSSAITLLGAFGQDLSSDTSPSGSWTTAAGGLAAGTSLSASVAVCVSWKQAQRYKGGHPRTYLAGLPTAATNSPSTISASTVTAVSAAANSLRTGIQGIATSGVSSASMVLVRYFLNKVPLTNPLTNVITASSVNSRLDSQRRRLGK